MKPKKGGSVSSDTEEMPGRLFEKL